MSGVCQLPNLKRDCSKNKSPSLWLALLGWKECCSDTKIPATGFFFIYHFIFKSIIHWGRDFLNLFLPAFFLFLIVCSFHLYKINLQTVNYFWNCSLNPSQSENQLQVFRIIFCSYFSACILLCKQWWNHNMWTLQERLNINSELVH